MRLWLLLAMGLSAAVGRGQVQSVSGQVLDSVSGQPIARALVRAGAYDTLTDHEGRFTLKVEQPVIAVKPGYFSESPVLPAAGSPLVVPLTPEAILYGTVTDTNGQPLQHLQVQLRQLQVNAGISHWQPGQSTTTNAEGEFRFAELMAGRYSLFTGLMVDGLADAASSLAFAPTRYPPAAADSIALRAGDHVEANLNPAGDKLYPVSGAIRGSPTQNAAFSVETQEGLPINPALHFIPQSGAFQMLLPSGTYRLKVQAQTQNTDKETLFAGMREISVGAAGLAGISITLTPLPSIPVELEYQQSKSDQEQPAPGFLSLSLVDDGQRNGFTVSAAQPLAEDLRNHGPRPGDPQIIRNVPPGRYVLQAQPQPPWYVASASCGNVDLMRDPLVVSTESGACAMRVVLRADAATLRWSVASGTRAIVVMAIPLANLTQDVSGNQGIDANGSLMTGTIPGLAPGRYLVIAASHPLDLAYRDPETLQKYLAWGKQVTMTAGSDAAIELELAPEEP